MLRQFLREAQTHITYSLLMLLFHFTCNPNWAETIFFLRGKEMVLNTLTEIAKRKSNILRKRSCR